MTDSMYRKYFHWTGGHGLSTRALALQVRPRVQSPIVLRSIKKIYFMEPNLTHTYTHKLFSSKLISSSIFTALWQRQTRGKGIFYQESYMLRHAEFKVML
jgi:hypothetical protein